MSALHAALDLPPAPRSVPAARRVVAPVSYTHLTLPTTPYV